MYVIGSSFFLKNAGGDDITTYCLLDSDYFTEENISDRYTEAKKHGVQLHIWRRKEIENYLVVAPAIQRIIATSCNKNTPPSTEDVIAEINRISKKLRDEIFDNICTEYAKNRALTAGTVNKLAREKLVAAWKSYDGRLKVLPGKHVISRLSDWAKTNYDVSFGAAKLAGSLRGTEIDFEIKVVVESIENHQNFPD